jgi:hypothetical protein
MTFFTLLFLLLINFSFADVIDSPANVIDFQQNPSSLNWKKIESEHFEIIFTEEIAHKAQRVTHLLETAYLLVSKTLEVAPKKISLILQNQSTESNGFVTLAPRRSEWYVTPAFDPELTNTEWLKTLAIHEFRHVVQFQKTRQGFNQVFEILLGEIGQALGVGLSAPPWFLEGDAVGIETALSRGGRGRLPLFERDLRTLLLSGRDYDYDKAHLGSYGHYIPNHYVYGYFYTSFLRNKHGDLFLSKLLDSSTSRTYNPLTFYNSYKSLTGINFEDFYRRTLDELIKNWREKEAELKLTPYDVKNIPQSQDWTNYLYPQITTQKKYFALKKGLSDISQFIITDGKSEETIHYPGPLINEYPYKVRNGLVAFIEAELDSRWGYRDFSRIRVLNLNSKKIVADFRKTKARLAVLNHSATMVLYVSWNTEQDQQMIITDLSGHEIRRVPFDPSRVITSLDWINDQEIVLVTKDLEDQKEILKYSFSENKEMILYPKSILNVGFVTSVNERILAESPKTGIDNVFEVKGGDLLPLTTSRFGAYAPTVFEDKLIYNDYSARGMNIVSKNLPWQELQHSERSFVPYFEKFAQSESQGEMDKDFFKMENYPVTSYSQTKKAFNLHSWVILAPPLSSTLTLMGISRDVLNKFSLSFGGNYNFNEKVTDGFVSAAWSHFYPVFDLRSGYGGRVQKISTPSGTKQEDHWEEGTFEVGLQIPWKRISGRFTHSFTLRAFEKLIKVTNKMGNDLTEISNGALLSPGSNFQYSFLSRLASRDINPEWGITFVTHFEEGQDISGKTQRGALLSQDLKIYLPGFLRHHSFFHQLAFEKQRDHFYQYKSFVLSPRGTQNVFLGELSKFSGNYLFPLFYPDKHFSRYAYFKRVAMNVFYDDLHGYDRSYKYYASSTGWELFFETHFLRIFIPLTFGIRGNYILHGEEGNNYEFFISSIGQAF